MTEIPMRRIKIEFDEWLNQIFKEKPKKKVVVLKRGAKPVLRTRQFPEPHRFNLERAWVDL